MSALVVQERASDGDGLPMPALFSEGGLDWRPISHWAEFLIQFGYRWPIAAPGQRRIALISMPCDSAAAGLIALGALIRDLGNDTATNVNGHYEALLRYARQYIKSCRNCEMRCHPEQRRCGYMHEAIGLIRDKDGKRYRISELTDFDHKCCLVLAIDRGKWLILPNRALDLRIDGEPPTRLISAAAGLPPHPYIAIVDGAKIIPSNLRETYSGLCLAGRVSGENDSRKVCDSIRFRCCDNEYSLSDLLTIQDWSASSTVSRVIFFNARTEKFDTHTFSPALAVADGDSCFLKVLARREFQQSDIIGVMHRTLDRDSLELVGNKMIDLRQWYMEDSETIGRMPTAPRAITTLVLARRIA
jgi:hypothetical protein